MHVNSTFVSNIRHPAGSSCMQISAGDMASYSSGNCNQSLDDVELLYIAAHGSNQLADDLGTWQSGWAAEAQLAQHCTATGTWRQPSFLKAGKADKTPTGPARQYGWVRSPLQQALEMAGLCLDDAGLKGHRSQSGWKRTACCLATPPAGPSAPPFTSALTVKKSLPGLTMHIQNSMARLKMY